MTKKLLFCLISAAFGVLSASAYNVSTEVEKRNVLIEDFSGIYCGYCYQAADIIEAICRNHEDVCAITMHAGHYAVPATDTKDLRTFDGNAIHDYFGISGYPSGTVNRIDQGETIITPRSNWTSITRDAVQEDAVVNLYAAASIDADRNLTVKVEGYYTGEPSNTENFLCVALIESDVLSYQSGTSTGYEYPEQNVLRKYLSDVWGDKVDAAKGTYFEKEFSYTVPEIHDVMPGSVSMQEDVIDLKGLEVVVYVLNNPKTEVLNATKVRPTLPEMEAPFAFKLKKPQIALDSRYGFNFFEAQFCNKSLEEATAATFNVEINDVTYTGTWNGSIAPLSDADIRISMPDNYVADSQNSYLITLSTVNGKEVDCEDRLYGIFMPPVEITPTINWTVKSDNESGDQLWRIIDEDGNTVEQITFEEQGAAQTVTGTTTLEDGKSYCIEAYNPWGDGFTNMNPGETKTKNAEIHIADAKGNEMVQVLKIKDFGGRAFFTTNSHAAVDEIAEDQKSAEFFNLQGVKLEQKNLAPGIYIKRQGQHSTKFIQK